MALILGNTKYTYATSDSHACGGEAELFQANIGLGDIYNEMLGDINYKIHESQNSIAIFEEHKGNTEYYQYFAIYDYIESFSEGDYQVKGNNTGFGFISLRII